MLTLRRRIFARAQAYSAAMPRMNPAPDYWPLMWLPARIGPSEITLDPPEGTGLSWRGAPAGWWVQVYIVPNTSNNGYGVLFDVNEGQPPVSVLVIGVAVPGSTIPFPNWPSLPEPIQGIQPELFALVKVRLRPDDEVATEWLPSTTGNTKPVNASRRWVKITNAPSPLVIDGQTVELGRGILYQQRGNLPRKEVGPVTVYETKDDDRTGQAAFGVQIGTGTLALVSMLYDEPVSEVPMPKCGQREGLYAVDNQFVCGEAVDPPWKSSSACEDPRQVGLGDGGNVIDFGAGQERIQAPSLVSSQNPKGTACGKLITPPKTPKWGTWITATFFDAPPSQLARRWVKIGSTSSALPWAYGTGTLFTNFGAEQSDVIIIELDTSDQSRPRALYVLKSEIPTPPPQEPWIAATFFDEPPSPNARRWVKIVGVGTCGGFWPFGPGFPGVPPGGVPVPSGGVPNPDGVPVPLPDEGQSYYGTLFEQWGQKQTTVVAGIRSQGGQNLQARVLARLDVPIEQCSEPWLPLPGQSVPEGWLSATFFDTPPSPNARRWVKLIEPGTCGMVVPIEQGTSYQQYFATLFEQWGAKQRAVIVDVRSPGAHPQARVRKLLADQALAECPEPIDWPSGGGPGVPIPPSPSPPQQPGIAARLLNPWIAPRRVR